MSKENRKIFDENQNSKEEKLPFGNVIDLTEDEDETDEKPAKKRVIFSSLTNSQSFEVKKPMIQKSDYLKTNIDHKPYSEQPGSSGLHLRRQRKNPRSIEGCVNCGANTFRFILLNCDHRFCYDCFKKALEDNTTFENSCPFNECNYIISDREIKNYLIEIPAEYISYLEHSRNVLRKALKIGKLEVNFLGTKSSSQLSNRNEIIMIQDDDISTQHRDLQELDNMSYIKNMTVFECPICFAEIETGQGVVLKNCLHSLCLECFREHVKMCDDPEVICPLNSFEGSCEFFIQEREIRAICDHIIYEIHLSKALKRAEAILGNVYHCKTPDCVGFIQHEGAKAFCCNLCDKVNCINCKTVHEVRKIIYFSVHDLINKNFRTKHANSFNLISKTTKKINKI